MRVSKLHGVHFYRWIFCYWLESPWIWWLKCELDTFLKDAPCIYMTFTYNCMCMHTWTPSCLHTHTIPSITGPATPSPRVQCRWCCGSLCCKWARLCNGRYHSLCMVHWYVIKALLIKIKLLLTILVCSSLLGGYTASCAAMSYPDIGAVVSYWISCH